MPKRYSAKEIVKKLKSIGFVIISQKGSHIKLRGLRHGKLQTAIVPDHKEMATGTFMSILDQANITKVEFEELN